MYTVCIFFWLSLFFSGCLASPIYRLCVSLPVSESTVSILFRNRVTWQSTNELNGINGKRDKKQSTLTAFVFFYYTFLWVLREEINFCHVIDFLDHKSYSLVLIIIDCMAMLSHWNIHYISFAFVFEPTLGVNWNVPKQRYSYTFIQFHFQFIRLGLWLVKLKRHICLWFRRFSSIVK